MKGVRFIAGTVFQMETIVFDEPLNAGFVHETVVLFRAVSGVGDDPFWKTTVTARERAKEWYEGQRVGRVRKEAKSVMNWFSVPICRLYPGLVCPFFMASSFMRMNVAPGSVLE